MCPAASAQNMNASSASGLWARWMVRMPLTAGGRLERVAVEGVEGVLVIGVLGSVAAALGCLVLEEVAESLPGLQRVAVGLVAAGPQHEREQMRRRVVDDRVGLRQGARGVAT